MLTYRREKLADIKDELLPLLEKHWRETALNQDTVPLNPDWATYDLLDATGMLVCVTARHQGALVGYAAYLISTNLHYTSVRNADNDIFWLDPAFRKGRAGIDLFRAAEIILVGEGVDFVSNKVKLAHDVGKVFEHMGYEPIERIYLKKLRG